MGWTYGHRAKGTTNRDYFQAEFPNTEIVDIASGYDNPTNVYAAIRSTDSKESGAIFALAILTHRAPKSHYNFGHKDIDEGMGPVTDDCPERILKLLSPVEDIFSASANGDGAREWAIQWRERARARLEQRKARPKLVTGLELVAEHDLHFGRYRVIRAGQSFIVSDAKRRIFSTPDGFRFRLMRNTHSQLRVVGQ